MQGGKDQEEGNPMADCTAPHHCRLYGAPAAVGAPVTAGITAVENGDPSACTAACWLLPLPYFEWGPGNDGHRVWWLSGQHTLPDLMVNSLEAHCTPGFTFSQLHGA